MASDSSQRDVLLLVSDTGAGIPEDLQGRLFEPFFSTKPEGKGSGLGLSTVYSMVKLHKGEISVTSEAGKGTTFSICFPEAGVWPKDVPVRESEVREAGAAAK